MSAISIVAKPSHTYVLIPLREITATNPLPGSVIDTLGISSEWISNAFKGKAKEVLPIFKSADQKYTLLGLGNFDQKTLVADHFRHFFFTQGTTLGQKISIDLRHLTDIGSAQTLITELIEGVFMGQHQSPKPLKPLVPSVKVEEIEICCGEKFAEGEKKNMIKKGKTLAEIRSTMIDLVNLPANFKTPVMMGQFVGKQGKRFGFDVQVLTEKALHKQGFHALLAIGQGSPNESVFITMQYQADRKDLPSVGLVGKGITFDTGGISIKPSDNMHFMKSDMGGAAAMIGTMMAVAALGLPIRLTAVVASAENMPDGLAVKPSDVISSYSGKTIEMIDTDAEGRVVLADALSWMVRNEKPDYLIDAATLTGSIVRALGNKAAGLFSKNDKLTALLIKCGEESGERLWPMPLWDDYLDEIASDVADVRNFSGVPTAGSISAAKFLEVFTDGHTAWAHLDIAGTAFLANPYMKMKSATGYGIKLLVHFVEEVSKK
jgi:leucyl aminopeptidase